MIEKKIGVVIVDDSLFIRNMFEKILSEDPGIKVLGSAEDPFEAREMIKRLNPDVITLDIEMPKMNGIEFLEKIMTLRPMPVVMVSTLTQKGAAETIQCLELGAIEAVGKPTDNLTREGIESIKSEIVNKIKIASKAKVRALTKSARRDLKPVSHTKVANSDKIIAIGASTGGVEALVEVLVRLPANMPPIVIVQHMPPKFTESFAKRLNTLCPTQIAEAKDGAPLIRGHVYIAPGDKHLRIVRKADGFICRTKEGEKVSGHCPSVDVLFTSVAKEVGAKVVGVILTGMGKDGAEGMVKMKEAGAFNIGQDEQSCVVYGMPREAMERGGVSLQAPLSDVAKLIVEHC